SATPTGSWPLTHCLPTPCLPVRTASTDGSATVIRFASDVLAAANNSACDESLKGTVSAKPEHWDYRPGRSLPPSKPPTGPASPRRSVCAPGGMTFSLYDGLTVEVPVIPDYRSAGRG